MTTNVDFTESNSLMTFFFCCCKRKTNYENNFHNGFYNMGFQKDNAPHSTVDDSKNEKARWIKPNSDRFPLKLYCEEGKEYTDLLHNKNDNGKLSICPRNACLGSVMKPVVRKNTRQLREKPVVIKEMEEFLDAYYTDLNKKGSPEHMKMVTTYTESIQLTGLYDITTDMLTFGAKTAWRNASRCVGRIQWFNLKLFDKRHVRTAKEMFDALCEHIAYANNNGNLRSAITVFPVRSDGKHDFRVWSLQLIAYAGYRQADGSIVGDPANEELTMVCERLGWKGKGTRFDILPLVLQANGAEPEVFELPKELIIEVNLTHPRYPWFKELGLKWFGLPAVAHMCFEVGGLEFPAAPFNGWYMGTEIGARDLCDNQRYNIVPEVAQYMDLDTTSKTTLWKDITVIEINVAVLHSFQLAGVTIMDHHTATETFITHMHQENISRGGCPADWVWIVPPISGSITPVFHMEMLNYKLKPSYEYQEVAWLGYKWKNFKRKTLRHVALAVSFSAYMMYKVKKRRIPCTILYATETGKSFQFAESLARICRNAFTTTVSCTDDYDIRKLKEEKFVLIVTSTFGEGDAPSNAKKLKKTIWELSRKVTEQKKQTNDNKVETDSIYLKNMRFSVFALGSRAYPKFCQFGQDLDGHLQNLGGIQIHEVGEGDELCGQETTFMSWALNTFKVACDIFSIKVSDKLQSTLEAYSIKWDSSLYRFRPVAKTSIDLLQALTETHRQNIHNCRLISRQNLQSNDSDRETILLKFEIPKDQEMKYMPGDHLGIFAYNSPEEVNAIMDHVEDVPQDYVDIKVQRNDSSFWKDQKRTPFCNLRTSLTYFLDIRSTVSQSLMEVLAMHANDEEERKILTHLSKDANAYQTWRICCGLNFVEILEEFPSLQFSTAFVLTQLPVLLHRFYSISSSQSHVPNEIHITVAVLKYETLSSKHPRKKLGFCSNWLNEIEIGTEVPCFIRHEDSFHLPENIDAPIIMVGPGTGIAPFRGFWQQRKEDKSNGSTNTGTMILYFGCRQMKYDHIFQEELTSMQLKGVLDKVHVAVSREPGMPKTYVQNLMEATSSDIYNNLVVSKGHLYICGEAGMASDVTTTLLKILEKEGKETEAKNTLNAMTEEGRIHRDIFGAPLLKLKSEEQASFACVKCSS